MILSSGRTVHSFRAFRLSVAPAALALLAAVACSDKPTGGGNHSAVAAIAITSGNGQVGVPGSPLSSPIAARVTNAQGNPVGGTSVTFAVTRGEGTVASTTVTTGSDGIAQTTWSLGSGAVRQEVKASAGSVTQTATATVDTTRSLFLLALKDTVSIGDTIWVDFYAGTSGLAGETRGAIQESITNNIPLAATQIWPVYFYYANDDIELAQPKPAELDFVTAGPTNTAARQRYLRVGYVARSLSGKDVTFTHAASGFFGARTFNDLLSRVSVVGTSVHIR